MAVALLDNLLPVRLPRNSTALQIRRVRTKAHRSAVAILREQLLLLIHDTDDEMLRVGIYLRGVRVFEPRDVPRILDDGELHAIAETKVRNSVLSRETDGFDFPLNACFAESAGNQNAVIFPERSD